MNGTCNAVLPFFCAGFREDMLFNEAVRGRQTRNAMIKGEEIWK